MTKFTYIIGAGASRNAVPIVKDIPDQLDIFFTDITNIRYNNPLGIDLSIVNQTAKDLFWLMEGAKSHASIDTFAKKLYLTGEKKKLRLLKSLLDLCLTYWQTIKPPDIRYDAFLATIFYGDDKTNITLPSNITFLSWNYDFQFEISLTNFFKNSNHAELESRCKLIPNIEEDFQIKDEFSIIKLNGSSTGLITSNNKFSRKEYLNLIRSKEVDFSTSLPDPFQELHSLYKSILNNYWTTLNDESLVPSILFAWENDFINKQIRKYAFEKIQDTEILVIIGYSFPTFNREIDKLVLNHMSKLKKIVLQVPNNDISSIEFRLRSLLDTSRTPKIDGVTSTDEFFIPFEF